MTQTKNDFPEKVRSEMIELLNARLADAIDLRLQTKQARGIDKALWFIEAHNVASI